jgi:hypothetical protein
MKCLQHFQSWPTYPRKLEEIISSACCPERMGAGNEHLAQHFAQQWNACLSGMLTVDPAARKAASEITNCDVWKPGRGDGALTMSNISPGGSSAGSSRSGRSSGSMPRARSGGTENIDDRADKALAEKPKLAMRGKRSGVQGGKAPLLPLQPSHQRRVSQMIPLEGLAAERAGDKEVTLTVRRASAFDTSSSDWALAGKGGVLGKASKPSRTKSTSGVINAAQQTHWPSGAGPMMRLSSSSGRKHPPSLQVSGHTHSLVLDSIG